METGLNLVQSETLRESFDNKGGRLSSLRKINGPDVTFETAASIVLSCIRKPGSNPTLHLAH